MPNEWGGAGLTLLDQVIVEEEFGKVTNCLWDIPWRPANVLAYGTAAQRESYLLPIIRGERFDAFAVTEPECRFGSGERSPPPRPAIDGGWLINGEKWFVTCGDVADFLVVQADVLVAAQALHAVPRREGHARRPDQPHPALHALRRQRASGVRVRPTCSSPTRTILGEIGQGFDLTKDWFTDERLMIAARTVGAAERALKLARDWARAARAVRCADQRRSS